MPAVGAYSRCLGRPGSAKPPAPVRRVLLLPLARMMLMIDRRRMPLLSSHDR